MSITITNIGPKITIEEILRYMGCFSHKTVNKLPFLVCNPLGQIGGSLLNGGNLDDIPEGTVPVFNDQKHTKYAYVEQTKYNKWNPDWK